MTRWSPAFRLSVAALLIGCTGTHNERQALRALTPLPTDAPSTDAPLSLAARQLDALIKLQPIAQP